MFAERIKELRKQKGLTQVKLAEAVGMSKGTVAMWETGKRQPNFDTLNDLSDLFDKRIDYILGYSNDPSSPNPTEGELDQMAAWTAEENFHETVIEYLRLDYYGKTAVEGLIRSEMERCQDQETLFPKSDYSVTIRIKNNG